jgi:hypothetical protein
MTQIKKRINDYLNISEDLLNYIYYYINYSRENYKKVIKDLNLYINEQKWILLLNRRDIPGKILEILIIKYKSTNYNSYTYEIKYNSYKCLSVYFHENNKCKKKVDIYLLKKKDHESYNNIYIVER